MMRFDTSVQIERPPNEVYDVVADPETYPRWNSAVRAVHAVPGTDGEDQYVIERDLPSGRARNLLEVIEATRPEEVVIRASHGPTPFTYQFRLEAAGEGATTLSLRAEVELPPVSRLFPPVAGTAVKRGVEANFGVLKSLLEAPFDDGSA
jgi:uncharacterized protein YndB with AHSA1/START domain